MTMQTISTSNAPKAVGPYSQAVKAGGLLFVSGQLGVDPATGALMQGGVEAEAAQALDNLKAVVEGAGLTLNDVVKTTVLLAHMGDFAKVNAVYQERFRGHLPARAAYAVAGLPLGALVEIEAVAAAG